MSQKEATSFKLTTGGFPEGSVHSLKRRRKTHPSGIFSLSSASLLRISLFEEEIGDGILLFSPFLTFLFDFILSSFSK